MNATHLKELFESRGYVQTLDPAPFHALRLVGIVLLVLNVFFVRRICMLRRQSEEQQDDEEHQPPDSNNGSERPTYSSIGRHVESTTTTLPYMIQFVDSVLASLEPVAIQISAPSSNERSGTEMQININMDQRKARAIISKRSEPSVSSLSGGDHDFDISRHSQNSHANSYLSNQVHQSVAAADQTIAESFVQDSSSCSSWT